MPVETPNATKPQRLVFRGFVARRRDGRWYAHCIDLTVDGLAETAQEAIDKAARAGAAYLNWASEHGEPLRRPSPLRFRIQYYLYAAQDSLRSLSRRPPKQNGQRHTFRSPLPA